MEVRKCRRCPRAVIGACEEPQARPLRSGQCRACSLTARGAPELQQQFCDALRRRSFPSHKQMVVKRYHLGNGGQRQMIARAPRPSFSTAPSVDGCSVVSPASRRPLGAPEVAARFWQSDCGVAVSDGWGRWRGRLSDRRHAREPARAAGRCSCAAGGSTSPCRARGSSRCRDPKAMVRQDHRPRRPRLVRPLRPDRNSGQATCPAPRTALWRSIVAKAEPDIPRRHPLRLGGRHSSTKLPRPSRNAGTLPRSPQTHGRRTQLRRITYFAA